MGFGETLRRLREDAGMTQEDVANALGITGAAVALWESGKNRPRLDKLNQLARLLGLVELVPGPPGRLLSILLCILH